MGTMVWEQRLTIYPDLLYSLVCAGNQPIASRQWHSGFLPSKYQGVHFHSKGDPVLYLSNPNGVKKRPASVIDSVNQLNRIGNRNFVTLKFPLRSANTKWHSVCNERTRSHGCIQGTKTHPGYVWSQAGRRLFCKQLPACQATGRKRGPIHSSLSSWMGPPWWSKTNVPNRQPC